MFATECGAPTASGGAACSAASAAAVGDGAPIVEGSLLRQGWHRILDGSGETLAEAFPCTNLLETDESREDERRCGEGEVGLLDSFAWLISADSAAVLSTNFLFEPLPVLEHVYASRAFDTLSSTATVESSCLSFFLMSSMYSISFSVSYWRP